MLTQPWRCGWSRFGGVLGVLAVAGAAWAQAGPALVLRPWPAEQRVELSAQGVFQDRGHVKSISGGGGGDARGIDTRLLEYDAQGRWQVNPGGSHPLSLGFEMTLLDLQADGLALGDNAHLADQSASLGLRLGQSGPWTVDLLGGVGFDYLGDDHEFIAGDEFYGRGDLVVDRRLDERSSLTLLLDYDGNRSILPDVPLPGVLYNHRVSPQLYYAAGLPYSQLHWEFLPRLSLEVQYALVFSLDAQVAYQLRPGLAAFAGYNNRRDPFLLPGTNRRVFFEQQRAEGGLRWTPGRLASLTFAAGYAFGQAFSTGWDSRDLEELFRLSDEPYVRVSVGVGF